jgi:hypothetical protein
LTTDALAHTLSDRLRPGMTAALGDGSGVVVEQLSRPTSARPTTST